MHRPINPEAVPAPLGGYSQAMEVRAGLRWLQVSGQIPESVDATIPDDFERQCNLVWDHLEQCLRSAGMRWQHLVHVRTYLSSREHAIATPFNDRVVELVHAMERGERSPAADELAELVGVAGR